MKSNLIVLLFLVIGQIRIAAQNSFNKMSDEEKIYGLSKVWKEADKNFVFFDQIPNVNWDSTYLSFLPLVLDTISDYEYFKVLQRFYSILKDGHTRVYVPWEMREIYEVSPALRTELIGDQVIIIDVFNDTIAKQGVEIGMEILKINGQDVCDYAKKNIEPYVFYSTIQDLKVQVFKHNLLKGHVDSLLHIKTSNKGIIQEFELSRKLSNNKGDKHIFEFELLQNGIGHFRINMFSSDDFKEKFDSVFSIVKQSEKLIIDVSDNIGGNTEYANYVLKHFVNKSFQTSNWQTPKYMPAYAAWGNELEWEDNKGYMVKPVHRAKRYNRDVIVLISEKTFSTGEDFVSAFLNASRGKVIGRQTAGSTGNIIGFNILGITGFHVCAKRDYLTDGQEFVGYGISPQIEVENSLNEEKMINKAIQILME